MKLFKMVIDDDHNELTFKGNSKDIFEDMVATFVAMMKRSKESEKVIRMISNAAHVAEMIMDDDLSPWKGGEDEDERSESSQA